MSWKRKLGVTITFVLGALFVQAHKPKRYFAHEDLVPS